MIIGQNVSFVAQDDNIIVKRSLFHEISRRTILVQTELNSHSLFLNK